MNYFLYDNPFYIPYSPYLNMGYQNNCIYSSFNSEKNTDQNHPTSRSAEQTFQQEKEEVLPLLEESKDFFSFDEDRLEVFGISINTDDLIILVMIFFMLKENHLDFTLIIILALILFDQS